MSVGYGDGLQAAVNGRQPEVPAAGVGQPASAPIKVWRQEALVEMARGERRNRVVGFLRLATAL